MKKIIFFVFLAMMTGISYAQDAEFSQYFAAPLYLNPAFAGTDSSARLNLNFRDQWPKMPGMFITYNMECSQYLKAIHGGFGLMAWNDNAGSGTMKTTNFSGMYSYQMNVTNDFTLSIGVQGAYMEKVLDWSKLTFGDQIDPRYGFIYTNHYANPIDKNHYFDYSAGIVGYTKVFYFGASVDHITQPDQGFISLPTPLPMKLMGNLGAMIPLDNSPVPIYLSPNIIYIAQQSFQQTNIGMYVQRSWLVAGMWYRYSPTNGDAIVATIGLQRWRFML